MAATGDPRADLVAFCIDVKAGSVPAFCHALSCCMVAGELRIGQGVDCACPGGPVMLVNRLLESRLAVQGGVQLLASISEALFRVRQGGERVFGAGFQGLFFKIVGCW